MHWMLPTEYPGHPAVYVLVAVVAFLISSVDKGGFGGVGILAVPLFMLVAPPRFALGMWLPLLILCDLCIIRAYPREYDVRPIKLLSPWMLLGLLVGWKLLGSIAPTTVKIFIGCLAMGFVVLECLRLLVARRLARHGELKAWRPGWLATAPFGLAGGISTMIAHSAGAITAIYFLPQRMDQRSYVGTSGRFYFLFNTLKVPFFVQLGLINRETLLKSLWLVPLAPVGVWLGSYLNRRLPAAAFRAVIYALLLITGVYLLYTNALAHA